MKEMEYVDEKNFKKEIIHFEDEHLDLAASMWKTYGNYGPFIVCDDKKSLCFAVNKYTGSDRVERELGKHLYKVKIEKIE
jgi:hypothetical protein